MQHSEEEWTALKLELQLLKEQNQALKRDLQQTHFNNNQQDEDILIRSTVMPSSKNTDRKMQKRCAQCGQFLSVQKTKEQIVTQFQSWSQKLSVDLFKRKDLEIRRAQSNESRDSPALQTVEAVTQFTLLEKMCLFGPSQPKAEEMTSKKMTVPHQLYYPQADPHFALYESYGFSLYPEEVDVKVVREKNKSLEIDRIIFRKGLKHSDCKLIIFQSKEQFCLPNDKIMKQYNPFSTVYCVSLDFSDYLYSDKPYLSFIDRSTSLSQDKFQELGVDKIQKVDNVLTVPQIMKKDNSVYGQHSVFKSKFCISVMSYYPLLDFFCQFLLQIINHIKIKRIEEHSKTGGNYQNIDIKYVIEQLKEINAMFRNLFSLKFDYGSKIQYKLGESNLQLSVQNPRQEMSRDWAYRMLRLIDKDLLYQIYCMVLQEQSIVFFCQNSYILTFMIYLFVGLLIHPFSYPHTIVSSIFQIDHLQTPFIAVMGLNKPNKWLQQNEDLLNQKIAGKILVHLQQQETKIKFKRKNKYAKSERLKKIFSNFYKRAEKLDSSSKHKDIISRQITKAENELTQQLLADLAIFYNEQLVRYMPAREIIDSIRKELSVNNQNQTTVSVKLIKTIEQYIAQSRKKIERDPFIDSILQKQIFSVYLTIKYDIE